MCNSLPSLHNYDVKWPNFNFFFEDENGKAINSTISVWTRALPPLFSSNLNPLRNRTTSENREMVWKDAESIFHWSFHGRRRCRTVRSQDRFQSRGQQLCKLLGVKESFNMWKEFNSHRIFFVHKHGRRVIVLYTNMAVVTSCENDLLESARHHAHTLDFVFSLLAKKRSEYLVF